MFIDQKIPYNIKFLWNHYLPSYFDPIKVITAILSICPSEACVERSFSLQAKVHSDEHNRISNEFIESETNIKMNFKK
jgi:hypothetical protein